jgi:hypothetical protein
VDDEEDELVILRGLLNRIEGERYALTWESGYEGGLAAVARREHDVYLID